MQYGVVCAAIAFAACGPAFGAPVAVNLASASSFALLGGTISNTGTSTITGNVGVKDAAGTITGFNPTGTVVGGSVIAPGSAASSNAYLDFVAAFDAASLLTPTQSYADLSVDRTFTGNNVYTFTLPDISTTTGIHLTFDAGNDPDAVFVIRTERAFTANGELGFILQNQARASNIFWIIGTIGTISVGSAGPMTFEGNILAGESFTMSAAAGGSGVLAGTIHGSVFAMGANTLAGTTDVEGVGESLGAAAVPEPGSVVLVGLGCLVGAWVRRRSTSLMV